eukprot:809653-Rhodomonas_salina.1
MVVASRFASTHTLSRWSGRKHDFAPHNKDVCMLMNNVGQSWIIDTGRALFNAMKKHQEQCQTHGP